MTTAELFAGLAEEHRRLVLSRMPRRGFRKGDTLFHEGDLGDSLHVLDKGTVAVRTSTPLGDIVTLAVMGAGASFGEQALLSDDARRTASVVALEPVETRVLHRHDFEQLRKDHPSVERFLVDLLSAQVRRLSALVLEAMYLPADQRVVRRMHELAQLYDRGGPTVDVSIRQEDLATMAGTTRQTTNQVLKSLEEAGVVVLGRGRVEVVDRAALANRAR